MSLNERIDNDLKSAMKSSDKIRLQTIRSIRALILEFEKSGSNKILTPEVEISMLSTAVKRRKESIEEFRKAGREDLVKKEEDELKILLEYLPAQLSEEEIFTKVKQIAEEIGATSKADFPKLMPVAIARLKGLADGKIIRQVAEKILS
jgi:uncharacterized protein YqeY